MKIMIYLKLAVIAMMTTVFLGCSTTTLLTSWRDSTAPNYSLKKPLIVSIVQKPLIRKKLEDSFVQSFKSIGIDALASYNLFPNLGDLEPGTVQGKLPSIGCDSILVIRLLDVKQETVHVPARTDVYGGRPAYYGSYGGYYANSVSIVSSPAYNYVEKKYVAESNIYDGIDGKMIWTGSTETEDTDAIDSAVADFTKVLMKDIRAKAVF